MKKFQTPKEQYFYEIQMKERERVYYLFDNYFKTDQGCDRLECTPIDSSMRYDGIFQSGDSTVVFEFKRRNITTAKYHDSFIERGKFLTLYEKYQGGYYTLYIVEYDDYYFLFDLNYHFFQFAAYDNSTHRHHFFEEVSMTKNMFEYENGEEVKAIRTLNYFDATYILDKEFNPCSYQQFLAERIKKTSSSER